MARPPEGHLPSDHCLLPVHLEVMVIDAPTEGSTLSVSGAARMLGVHANTVRAWTDQGRLSCIRINDRGDRRYRDRDLLAFLADAGLQAAPAPPFQSRLRPASPRRLTPVATTPVAWQDAPLSGGRGTDPPRRAGGPPRAADAQPEGADPSSDAGTPDPSADARALSMIAGLAAAHARTGDLEATLRTAIRRLRDTGRFSMLAVARWQDERLVPRLTEGSQRARAWWRTVDPSLARISCTEGRPIAASVAPHADPVRRIREGAEPVVQVYTPIGGGPSAWGVLVSESWPSVAVEAATLDLLAAVGGVLGMAVGHARLSDTQARLAAELAAADARQRALATVTSDLGAGLELPSILERLVEHAQALLGVARAAVFMPAVDGALAVPTSAGLSPGFLAVVGGTRGPTPYREALETGRLIATPDLLAEAHDAASRDAIAAEGIRSAALVPLASAGEALGVLAVFRDTSEAWSNADLDLFETLASQAGTAVRNARDLARTTSWAAQLESIQALGARLARLATVSDIGQAICLELRGLIAYHNVRVYRVQGDEVVPIAWRGEIGEYTGEMSDQLRLTVGEGITGWVAQHGVAEYLPDASADPRAQTIPGTEDDLDESMLLAPMRYDDRVIGVIVLSKLGIDRFGRDDLRYLEIYASMAAQALVNADSSEMLRAQSERLERQLETQRELIRITESILSSLDPRTVVAEIADRLGTLVPVDTLGLDLYEPADGRLVPIYARGVHAEAYLTRTLDDHEGVGGWVARHGVAQLVEDELADPRVAHLDGGPTPGALIVAPLHGREGVSGILTLERLGAGARFETWEYELVTLFAGHVSIALANAVTHQAVEQRAMTDALTALKNHGTFVEHLTRIVARGQRFSLLMIDLDDFKSYNDQDGHEAGNQLLQAIARRLEVSVRDSDEVYRYGGDEFAIILPSTLAAGALEVARKVGAAVRGADEGRVTCSVGVASFPADATDRDGILVAADRACYAAKRSGRDRVATAAEGLELASEVLLPPPTPVDGIAEPVSGG